MLAGLRFYEHKSNDELMLHSLSSLELMSRIDYTVHKNVNIKFGINVTNLDGLLMYLLVEEVSILTNVSSG